jgi:hypothetical protein
MSAEYKWVRRQWRVQRGVSESWRLGRNATSPHKMSNYGENHRKGIKMEKERKRKQKEKKERKRKRR